MHNLLEELENMININNDIQYNHSDYVFNIDILRKKITNELELDSSKSLIDEVNSSVVNKLSYNNILLNLINYICSKYDIVKCNICREYYDLFDCKIDINIGYICNNCEDEAHSRGEKLIIMEE